MKLILGTLALALGAINPVSAFTETLSCYNKKCTGACTPSNGGREGTPTMVQWGKGQPWCYIQYGPTAAGDNDPKPITCFDGIGCGYGDGGPEPKCMSKDWDENMGGCAIYE